MKKRIVIVLFVCCLLLAGFIRWRNVDVFKGTKIHNPDCYSLDFTEMNQTDVMEIDLKDSDELQVDFSIQKGKADLIIEMGDEVLLYQGNNITTGSFVLKVSETGIYQIKVVAKHAAGAIRVEKIK